MHACARARAQAVDAVLKDTHRDIAQQRQQQQQQGGQPVGAQQMALGPNGVPVPVPTHGGGVGRPAGGGVGGGMLRPQGPIRGLNAGRFEGLMGGLQAGAAQQHQHQHQYQQGDFLADAMADELRAKLREMAKQVAELQVRACVCVFLVCVCGEGRTGVCGVPGPRLPTCAPACFHHRGIYPQASVAAPTFPPSRPLLLPACCIIPRPRSSRRTPRCSIWQNRRALWRGGLEGRWRAGSQVGGRK